MAPVDRVAPVPPAGRGIPRVPDTARAVLAGLLRPARLHVRPHLAAARGYSREDRAINIRRIGWVAGLLARNGVVVLVSAIAPFRDVRNHVRAAHEASGSLYLEVHVSTPVEVASERDVKGLYAGRRVGEISGLTGVDDPYGEPLAPDLVTPRTSTLWRTLTGSDLADWLTTIVTVGTFTGLRCASGPRTGADDRADSR